MRFVYFPNFHTFQISQPWPVVDTFFSTRRLGLPAGSPLPRPCPFGAPKARSPKEDTQVRGGAGGLSHW